MFLDVKELAVRKLRIHKVYAPGSIDFHSAEIKQIEPLEVNATAELLEGQIRIEGNFETKMELVCARCLEPLQQDVQRNFDLLYRPQGADAGRDEMSVTDAEEFFGGGEAHTPAAHAILGRLADGDMPCDGAWPAEQVELFRSWVEAGTPA